MKKIFFLFVVFALAMTTYAQKEHMKFMGIPLNMTINAFQTKLAAKGIKPYVQLNATTPVGVRAFKGIFAGYEAEFFVYYNKNSKIVYRAKACINETNEGIFEQRYNEFKDLVESKYSGYRQSDTQNGHESISIKTLQGYVSVYTSKYVNSYPISYTIHIDYEDDVNSSKNRDSKLDDI